MTQGEDNKTEKKNTTKSFMLENVRLAFVVVVLVKIPKAALNHVAGALDTLLRNACQLPATGAWKKVFLFSL